METKRVTITESILGKEIKLFLLVEIDGTDIHSVEITNLFGMNFNKPYELDESLSMQLARVYSYMLNSGDSDTNNHILEALENE